MEAIHKRPSVYEFGHRGERIFVYIQNCPSISVKIFCLLYYTNIPLVGTRFFISAFHTLIIHILTIIAEHVYGDRLSLHAYQIFPYVMLAFW